MFFGEPIYLFLVNFVGKGIVYLDYWGENLISTLFSKKKQQSMTLRSKQCSGCFISSASFN